MDKWLKNNTLVTKDKDRIYFEGYKPNYYFRNLTDEEQKAYEKCLEKISEPTGINLFDGYAECTTTSSCSKGYTLDDITKAFEKLNQLPPVANEIEIGSFALQVLLEKIPTTQDIKNINMMYGIPVVISEGDDLKFNQMKVKYSDGNSKVIDVFTWNKNISIYDEVFKE